MKILESGNETSNGCESECQEQVRKHSVDDQRDLLHILFTIIQFLGTNEIVLRIVIKFMDNKLFHIHSLKKLFIKVKF